MNTKVMLRKFGKYFPKKYAKMNHDHVGLMTGKLPEEVKKVLLCLDCDWKLLPYIKENKPDLIISHHPFIYGTKAKVFKWDESKRLLCEEIDKLGIPVYSLHTNFDTGEGGMNDALANALNLKGVYAPMKDIMMRIGELETPMQAEEFAKLAKKVFNVDYALLINEGSKNIKKVGIVGGGGSRNWRIAQEEGCDIYISGDAPHYVRRDVVNSGYNYLDMPHEIENIFMPTMKKFLLGIDSNLEVIVVTHETLPKVI